MRLADAARLNLTQKSVNETSRRAAIRANTQWRVDGKDVHGRLSLSPWEAALGASVQVRMPADDAVEVTVPGGWTPGRKLRLKGRGIPASEPGDLYLVLEVVLPAAVTDGQRAAYSALAQAFPGFDARTSAVDSRACW